MKVSEWLAENTNCLKTSGIKSARLDCLLLLEKEIEKPREWVLSHDDAELTDSQLQNLNKMITRRMNHEPVAYIIGSKEFYGRRFIVTPDVLIPRPESETIIDLLLSLSTIDYGLPAILDIGTGSGCLAITAKLELPDAEVIAIDISNTALAIAKQNANTLKADVQFIKSNLLSSISHLHSSVFLVNLPYVPDGLITSEEITKEPGLALFSGQDGLDHYKKFWQQIASLKHRPQHVITESLNSQHQQMTDLAQAAGYCLDQTVALIQQFSLLAPLPK